MRHDRTYLCQLGDDMDPETFAPGKSLWVETYDPTYRKQRRFERKAIGEPWVCVSVSSYTPRNQTIPTDSNP